VDHPYSNRTTRVLGTKNSSSFRQPGRHGITFAAWKR
jgi:hypothetical protein